MTRIAPLLVCLFFLLVFPVQKAPAAKLTLELEGGQGVTFVGAVNRWDQDGNARRKVDPKARIDAPTVDATAEHLGENKWVFKDLPKGKYDLILMGPGKVRIEGFFYAPVLEFDPFFESDATTTEEAREYIVDHIKKSRHYENKVEPLYLGGNKKAVRVLVMLMRDLPTSYTAGAGTLRHEIWQYTWNYGGWVKEKRTRVLDRLLMQVSEMHRWTWLWDPKLGGIEVKNAPVTLQYDLGRTDELKGMRP